MNPKQWFERSEAYQICGTLLLIAPILNFVGIALTSKNLPETINVSVLMDVASQLPFSHYMITVISFVLAFLAFKKDNRIWDLLIGFLLFASMVQIPNLASAWSEGGIQFVSITINFVLVLALVGFLKFKNPFPKGEASVPVKKDHKGDVIIHNFKQQIAQGERRCRRIHLAFNGGSAWARLTGLSDIGLAFRNISGTPIIVAQREIEMNLTPTLSIPVKFFRQEGNNYYFLFQKLRNDQIRQVNEWLAKG